MPDPDDPLAEAHQAVANYLSPLDQEPRRWLPIGDLWQAPGGRAIQAADEEQQVRLARAAAVQLTASIRQGAGDWQRQQALRRLLSRLLQRRLPLAAVDLVHLVRLVAESQATDAYARWPAAPLLSRLEEWAAARPITPELRRTLQQWLRACQDARVRNRPRQRCMARLMTLLEAAAPEAFLASGEPWADAVLTDLAAMPPAAQQTWQALLAHAAALSGTRPTAAWRQAAAPRLAAVGAAPFQRRLAAWLPGFVRERERPLAGASAALLTGLVWLCGQLGEEVEVRPLLRDLGLAAYHKIPGHGARSHRVGNACVLVLGDLGAYPELVQLRLRVRYRQPQALIRRALQAAAGRAGVLVAELEEMSVPTYGLAVPGRLSRPVGAYTAELQVAGSAVQLRWRRPDGKWQQSVPAVVRREEPEALKSLQRAARDVKKMLPAQRARLEGLLAARDRHWSLPEWRERYLDHPLVGSLARRLIWSFRQEDRTALGAWRQGRLVDVNDRPLTWLTDDAAVRLWHPLEADADLVQAWRTWLMDHRVTQPFKQAHREVYPLTAAELETSTYSNRFAAHLLRQHQFSALCRARDWRYALQGHWDGHNVPRLALPEWDVAVEFWVDLVGPGGGAAVSSGGISLLVRTDQVRFTSLAGEPLPLVEVPARAFSEAMRDVDLFVGVCSVGNDPAWTDNGQRPQPGHYWHEYAFGDLSAAAEIRREVLQQLVPRLHIAAQCAFDGNYLVVAGRLRTYRIHLGSGNILMEPNHQYLCIVPDPRAPASREAGQLFLPFEGDTMVSLILSKALLLARDDRLTDPAIRRQIRP